MQLPSFIHTLRAGVAETNTNWSFSKGAFEQVSLITIWGWAV
uniref:Uncharacterized protein n=1 Tax=Anguilla anguilla TaxID=7936 RepID=A0A0E9XWI0_ANGAN